MVAERWTWAAEVGEAAHRTRRGEGVARDRPEVAVAAAEGGRRKHPAVAVALDRLAAAAAVRARGGRAAVEPLQLLLAAVVVAVAVRRTQLAVASRAQMASLALRLAASP